MNAKRILIFRSIEHLKSEESENESEEGAIQLYGQSSQLRRHGSWHVVGTDPTTWRSKTYIIRKKMKKKKRKRGSKEDKKWVG